MTRRLFDAVVRPTVSCEFDVWGTLCAGGLSRELKKIADLQLAFLCQIFQLKNSVTAAVC